MTAVTVTYIMMADEGFRMQARFAYPAGIIVAVFVLAVYITQVQQWRMAPAELRDHWEKVR